MLLFWKHGYESTSLNDLTAALGVKPSSIYSVFGDKKRLFLEAVSLYTSGPVTADSIIEQASTAREAAQDLLTASVLGFTGDDTPKGCLLATSAISCSEGAEDIQAQLAAIRIGIETRLRNKINADVDAGRMPDGVDSEALAAHVLAVIQGLSTLARDGAQREKLLRLATVAMASWPGNPGG
jgi:AcrR family transcriptional regulator